MDFEFIRISYIHASMDRYLTGRHEGIITDTRRSKMVRHFVTGDKNRFSKEMHEFYERKKKLIYCTFNGGEPFIIFSPSERTHSLYAVCRVANALFDRREGFLSEPLYGAGAHGSVEIDCKGLFYLSGHVSGPSESEFINHPPPVLLALSCLYLER